MEAQDIDKIVEDLEAELAESVSVGVLGLTPVARRLLDRIAPTTMFESVEAVFSVEAGEQPAQILSVPVRPIAALAEATPDVLIVAADAEKEDLLRAALPFIQGAPKVIISGYGHFAFRDPSFHELLSQLLVPSLANGYPNTLVHLYQCLVNAARLDLSGVVVELGAFKGGTTMFLSQVIERLGKSWPVLGFDTWDGFPPRRSPLDMYAHPGCTFRDFAGVQRYLDGRDVELVPGDLVETCGRLSEHDLVLSFVDTDNYSPATAALEIIREKTVVGGAIVFDHYTGVDRFRYTLGERMAAKLLEDDVRYFNLHSTGVFLRQR